MILTAFTTWCGVRWQLTIALVLLTLSRVGVAANNQHAAGPSNEGWQHSGSMWLLTTAAGAHLPAEAQVEQFPVLVRLHGDTFDFEQAQPHGEDLRFFTRSGERLAHQIETWNAVHRTAVIWVRVPLIRGDSRQEILVYWGNPAAMSESDGAAVFGESNGYLSVWHMQDPVHDEVGSTTCEDSGTTPIEGVIGPARHFDGSAGVFGGEKISNYPAGSAPHSTEVWFRAKKPNCQIVGWGNEEAQGKVVMQYISPPRIRMDCYFSDADVRGQTRVPLSEWVQVVHTYERGDSRVYVNGVLDHANRSESGPLAIQRPARLFLGGWYHRYDFVGDLDEVRISKVVRSPDWVKLQFENQKPAQTLVGPIVQPGAEFSVTPNEIVLGEGQTTQVEVRAGGAQKLYWILNRSGQDTLLATDRYSLAIDAGRVVSQESATLTIRAIFENDEQIKTIPITIVDEIPEPVFTLAAPTAWDGREAIEVVPLITNRDEMQARNAGTLNFSWTADGVAVLKRVEPDRLILRRAQGSGTLRITAAIENGGAKVTRSIEIAVQEPEPTDDDWVPRPVAADEQPEDNQFVGRDNRGFGSLIYSGTLKSTADSVFLRVFADDELYATETVTPGRENRYLLVAKLRSGLVHYRTEFGTVTGNQETVLHTARNIMCGDAYLIMGQSNAVATDFGEANSQRPNEWLRTYGATAGDPAGARNSAWAMAVARSPGGIAEIGYWGMELGRRLIDSERTPVCIINGAVGGSRIDQHQRNVADPTDVSTIYGRQLWRVQQARLTHSLRAVIWHQGENDQGADGPTGGYGYETYRQIFVDLAASWKDDYPNIQQYYAFQIWPKACAMGIDGSDNRLREVQRTLPGLFSNLTVISTVGIKPPGGCHFPAAGYAEFARMLHPLIQAHLNHRSAEPFLPPNLQRAYFTTPQHDELTLEFDRSVLWLDSLKSQFHLIGDDVEVVSGVSHGQRITLQLQRATTATMVTYLDSNRWDPDHLLYGENGLAALTFCEVPIEAE